MIHNDKPVNIFKQALRESATAEFTALSSETTEHAFSPRFEKKMNRLIKSLNERGTTPLKAFCRRTMFAAASFVVIFTLLSRVQAIREPFMNFVYDIYDTFIAVHFEQNVQPVITYEYQLTYIPDGFSLTDSRHEDCLVYEKYEDAHGNSIIFTQELGDAGQISLDNEHSDFRIINISGLDVIIQETDSYISGIWTQDTCCLKLFLRGDFDLSDLESMIMSVQPIANNCQ
ncbi:MAG: DUF4367 domain-containing protein [Lachnospiraceae bacterium]|nr:DUF4367 domain-containing protein [Lachnospiraceae bacterium]